MTEPHVIGIDSRDLRDLIDDRDRLETSLAECARSAMDSAAEWQAELDKAGAVNADLQRFHRDVQEALGYDQADLVAMADLVADIRRLVERQLSEPARPQYMAHGLAAPVRGDLSAGWGMGTDELVHHWAATSPAEPATPATPAHATGGVVTADMDLFQGAAVVGHLLTDAMLPLDNAPGWSHNQDGPPAAPRARTWQTGDHEPATAGPGAVWGVTTEIGDLYRPEASEEHGWIWARADGIWWRWTVMLTEGAVTEAFPPSPTPRTIDVELPADEVADEPTVNQ